MNKVPSLLRSKAAATSSARCIGIYHKYPHPDGRLFGKLGSTHGHPMPDDNKRHPFVEEDMKKPYQPYRFKVPLGIVDDSDETRFILYKQLEMIKSPHPAYMPTKFREAFHYLAVYNAYSLALVYIYAMYYFSLE